MRLPKGFIAFVSKFAGPSQPKLPRPRTDGNEALWNRVVDEMDIARSDIQWVDPGRGMVRLRNGLEIAFPKHWPDAKAEPTTPSWAIAAIDGGFTEADIKGWDPATETLFLHNKRQIKYPTDWATEGLSHGRR